MEIGEDVELGLERLAILEPDAAVASGPAKRLARADLQAGEVDPPSFQQPAVLDRKILAHHRDQPDGSEHRRREAEVAGCAAEHLADGFRRRADGVESDRTDHEDRLSIVSHLELQMRDDVVFRQVVGAFEKF